MDDAEIHSLDESVIGKLYFDVVSGRQLSDDVIPTIIVYMHQQLRCWKDSQNTMPHERDNILLCLSTLLSAAKKNLCKSATLPDIMKNTNFILLVSIYVEL